MRDFCSSLKDLIFPRRCLVCEALFPVEKRDVSLCNECLKLFQPLSSPLCIVCGSRLHTAGDDGVCERCLRNRPPYTLCRSLFLYNKVMRKLLLQFKYRRDLLYLNGIRQLCASADLSLFAESDLIVPVPLHKNRLQKRGFNQSLLLAKLFFDYNDDVKIAPKLLKRVENTVSQSSLSRHERLRNLKNVFAVSKDYPLFGKKVCLVDDVMTTGTTVKECCYILLKSGAYSVSVLTLARSEKHF